MSAPAGLIPPPVICEDRRNWTGWIVLTILISLQILLALSDSLTQKPPKLRTHDDEQETLQSEMRVASRFASEPSKNETTGKTALDDKWKELDSTLAVLAKQPKADTMATKLSLAMLTELHRPIQAGLFDPLLKSRSPVDKLFVEIYGSSKLSPAKANQMVALLPDYPFVYKAAKVHALQKAGDQGALNRLVPVQTVSGTGLVGFLSMVGIYVSISVWTGFWRRYRAGTLLPRGMPMSSITPLDADRLAIRAAQIFALFLIAQTIAAVLPRDAFNLFGRVIAVIVLMVAGVVGLQRFEIEGKRITLKMLGLSTCSLKDDILLGIQGFFAEFPIAMVLAGIGAVLFSFLPKATHPATEALSRDHSLGTLLPIVLLGSVLAPFWEELVFRGLLFPALNRLMGGLIPSILVSSFLFASMHPQGISIWLALAGVGAASCMLSYQSRSLVPSMVMHCLHNSAVFALTLLVQ
ncbi:MAG: type II CAAX endopeptidase family protein [Fimbriimonas sp.]|nr:type II CAAX endopeptidase family protein [Fimbriimonas sp.]